MGRVAVTVDLAAPNLNPADISALVGVGADKYARAGDDRFNAAGHPLLPHEEGWWRHATFGRIESKDVNAHFRYLLNLLLPHQQDLLDLCREGEVWFGVLWESSYLYAGTGPMLDADVISGIAALKAGVGFDIYQINPETDAFGETG